MPDPNDNLIRTPREWTETCRECCGTGIVHKREHFSLWTPAEYAQHMPAEFVPAKLKPGCKGADDLPANVVICVAHGGASIFEACKEGVTLARAFGKPVAFEFNGAVAVCHGDADPEHIAKQWWKLAYGQTYEQSMRDR